MTRITILITTILFCISSLSARTIKGEVRSDNDSTIIVGASCRLLSGSQLIKFVTTDEKGVFEISTDNKSKLQLAISMTGSETAEIMIDSDKNVDIGTIYLPEGITLAEVQVTARSVTEAKGRTIIFPSGSDVKASPTAISLFQKLPLAGLEANPINRTLTVDGGSPVILINGVPSNMDDLNSLQPEDIAKIEFSRITPARYADRDNSGFLNITLKKRNDGGQLYFWGRSAVNTAFVDGNIRASYHQGPSQFTLTYTPSWRNYQKVYDNLTESYIGEDFQVKLEQNDRNPFFYHYHNIGVKYDYSPNANTLFTATFRMTPAFNGNRSLANISDSYLGKYENNNYTSNKDLTPSLDLFSKGISMIKIHWRCR